MPESKSKQWISRYASYKLAFFMRQKMDKNDLNKDVIRLINAIKNRQLLANTATTKLGQQLEKAIRNLIKKKSSPAGEDVQIEKYFGE